MEEHRVEKLSWSSALGGLTVTGCEFVFGAGIIVFL